MADPIDSIVKGAPQTDVKPPPMEPIGETKPGDPLHHTPSSPSMIYLNMLILEASLRAQFLELRTRRRKHTFFLGLLAIWNTFFGYCLFFAPREDGSGMGGSVYWMVDMAENVCFMAGVLTGVLVWATGIWDRGIRWPRRWLGISNRGLRGFNCKLVVIKRPLLIELFSTMAFFFTYGAFSSTAGQYRYVDPSILREVDRELNINRHEHPTLPYVTIGDEEKGGHEEDLAPGGDYVKLLLLAKPFSPNFRENWELYRTEYWDKENERRSLLRVKLAAHDKRVVKERYGWRWWLPWYRSAARAPLTHDESEKHHPHHMHHAHHHRAASISREEKRTRSGSIHRNSSSAGSTRSRTPGAEVAEDGTTTSRRASVSSNASDKKRKKHLSSGSRSKRESRSLTPEISSPLAQASKTSDDVA